MSNIGDDRGTGTTPPEWWLKMFHKARIEREEEIDRDRSQGIKRERETTVSLGVVLAELVKRPEPWNHSAVSNFINGKRYTREMAEAFSLHYGIDRFETVVRAETPEQAADLERFMRRFSLATPVVNARVSALDAQANVLAHATESQMRPITSANEGPDRGRRARRTARRS